MRHSTVKTEVHNIIYIFKSPRLQYERNLHANNTQPISCVLGLLNIGSTLDVIGFRCMSRSVATRLHLNKVTPVLEGTMPSPPYLLWRSFGGVDPNRIRWHPRPEYLRMHLKRCMSVVTIISFLYVGGLTRDSISLPFPTPTAVTTSSTAS